jgi:hypothetical protein
MHLVEERLAQRGPHDPLDAAGMRRIHHPADLWGATTADPTSPVTSITCWPAEMTNRTVSGTPGSTAAMSVTARCATESTSARSGASNAASAER